MIPISIVWTVLLVIAFFGVMIFAHELGHYVVARLCKVRVLEFALGMGPKLLCHRSKKSGILYSLRLFPIGGFCSMLGENDDGTLDADDNSALCRRPRWQRFLVLFAGSFMNILTAFIAMYIVLAARGFYVSNTVDGFYISSYSKGLKIGDVITAVDDMPVENQSDIDRAIAALQDDLCTLTVSRAGVGEDLVFADIALPQSYDGAAFSRRADFVVGERDAAPTEVTRFRSASSDAGLLPGDTILRVNGKPISVYTDVSWEIAFAGSDPCSLTVSRAGETVTLSDVVFPVTSEDGVVLGSPDFALKQQPLGGFFDTLRQSVLESVSTIKVIYRSLVELIAGRFGTAGVSGPVGAAQTISTAASFGFIPLLYIFVFISMNLGLFNLLPLPALDGGRLIFLIIEMIRRKPLNQKYEGLIHFVGLILLMALMAVITVKDVAHLITG